MKYLAYLREIPKLFNWYFTLSPLKRIQLNYIILLTIVLTVAYFNDQQHRENYTIVSNRIDSVNTARAKEQEQYSQKLVYYTEKFNNLLEILIKQNEPQKLKTPEK